MKGATLGLLHRRLTQAVAAQDLHEVRRTLEAEAVIITLPATARRTSCVWASSDTCRHCPVVGTCSLSSEVAA